jgi:uncharacterized membrane protein
MRCLLFAILICAAGPASAKLAVCNKTAAPAKVALGRFDGATWMSEGWWTIAPGTCATLLDTPLKARYYYLFATDGGAGSWSGSRAFCVSQTGKFSIGGRSDCASRGYDEKSFFEVDTGNKPDWTQYLSD